MTQDHKVPTQFEIDGYIEKAKIMRSEVLAAHGKRLFQLPAKVMKSLSKRSTTEFPVPPTAL